MSFVYVCMNAYTKGSLNVANTTNNHKKQPETIGAVFISV